MYSRSSVRIQKEQRNAGNAFSRETDHINNKRKRRDNIYGNTNLENDNNEGDEASIAIVEKIKSYYFLGTIIEETE